MKASEVEVHVARKVLVSLQVGAYMFIISMLQSGRSMATDRMHSLWCASRLMFSPKSFLVYVAHPGFLPEGKKRS